MTISSVNLNNADVLSLYQQLKQSLGEIETDVTAGDTARAQNSLNTYQTALSSISSVTGISGTGASVQIKSDLSALLSYVQSGDQAGAQTALTRLTQDQSAQTAAMSNFGSDLSNLLQSVQSADATGAQTAANAVASDLQAILGTSSSDAGSAVNTTASSASSNASSGQNSFLGNIDTLLKDVQSQDTAAAQTTAGSVEQDLETSVDGSYPPPSPLVDNTDARIAGLAQDLGSLLSAVSSGDMTSSQTAANAVKSDLEGLLNISQSNASGSIDVTASASSAASSGAGASTGETDAMQLANSLASSLISQNIASALAAYLQNHGSLDEITTL